MDAFLGQIILMDAFLGQIISAQVPYPLLNSDKTIVEQLSSTEE